MSTFWFFFAIIALIVFLLMKLFKSNTQNQNASNASDESNASEPHYYPDNVGMGIRKEYLDPYDQSPLLPDAKVVSIRLNGKNLSFKTNTRNVNRVKRHGLPLKNKSFIKGNNYYISYTNSSSIYYDDGDNNLDWWEIYWLVNILTDDTNYQPIYGDNNFLGYGNGQTAGAGVDGEYNTTINEEQNDFSQSNQDFDPNNIEPSIILSGDDGTTIIGSERDNTNYQDNYTQDQDNYTQDEQNLENSITQDNDVENVSNFS